MSLAFSYFRALSHHCSSYFCMCNSLRKGEAVQSVGHGPCLCSLMGRMLEKVARGCFTRCESG